MQVAIAQKKDEKITVPLDVAEMHVIEGFSLIKAWRIYQKKTQREVAQTMGITQGAFSQMEKSQTNQRETLQKIAAVFGISPMQLTMEE